MAVVVYRYVATVGSFVTDPPGLFDQMGSQNRLTASGNAVDPKTSGMTIDPLVPLWKADDPAARPLLDQLTSNIVQ